MRFRTRRRIDDVRLAAISAGLAWRRRARLLDQVTGDASIIVVTWNTLPFLQTLLRAVETYTTADVEIVVVDNNSDDQTREYLRTERRDVRLVALRRNRGHGLALDAGVQAARGRYVVTLDVDAFPISPEWLTAVIEPLRCGYTLAGASLHGYIHPCYMAIERERFLRSKYTFAASYHRRLRIPHRGRPKGWDTGKLITLRDRGPHFEIPPSSIRGPGSLGTVFGELVYHHFYGARLRGSLPEDAARHGVTPVLSRLAWDEAVHRYLSS